MGDMVATKREAVISSMISSLRSGENRKYYVGLVGYYIEGVRYSATGLSVDLTATTDICRTDAGFACTALFPPEMIQPETVKADGIEKITVGGQVREVVRVRLEVMIHDVWSVAEFIDGQQHDLFLDSETLKARLGRFLDEPH
ncbi:MAG TPA: hypothetical protein VN966_04390 [Candidatus Bathyarchaeia archaeon]|nr:hypothetical protein [Candidatus Bathyarchaeia archaeon]